MTVPRLLALQHRNFRLLWTGQLISFSGSNMQTAAILWHVSLLVPPAQRPIALGMVGLVRLMPIIFFSIAGGTLADASDRRRVMLFTQSAMALTALALAVLTLSRVEPSLADLRARRDRRRRRRIRQSRAPVADADARAARSSAERDQPERHHGAGRVGRRSGDRRPHHRHARRGVGVRRQRAHVRLRHRRAR